MATFIALLRGINVSGHRPVKMDHLKAMFEKMGYDGIKTYIQSGNVIFSGSRASAETIAKQIEAEFGFQVPVLVKQAKDLQKILKGNPFLKDRDATNLHVTFLSGVPAKADLKKLETVVSGKDEFRAVGNIIYLHCPKSYGLTKFSNQNLEKWLSVGATTRNWKTVNELYRLATE